MISRATTHKSHHDGHKTALVLGGGAPTLTLMAGALLALDEQGVEFDVISTSGAGMLLGLLYAAPKGGDRRAALRKTVEALGVHDFIYRMFPINFKVFYKPGLLANQYYQAVIRPFAQLFPGSSDEGRLLKDLVHFGLASCSPSSLTPMSLGMCQPAPWLEDVVDFDAFQHFDKEFYINAWSIRERRMRIFGKERVDAAHFRAALAFPFIYPPFQLDGDWYLEGSAMDTLNLGGLLKRDHLHGRIFLPEFRRQLQHHWHQIQEAYASGAVGQVTANNLVVEAMHTAVHRMLKQRVTQKAAPPPPAPAPPEKETLAAMKGNPVLERALRQQQRVSDKIATIDKVVVFDVMGTEQLIRKPRDLWDAYVLSIIVPLVANADSHLKLFEREYDPYHEDDPRKLLHKIRFADQIPLEHWPHVLDWSYSNLETLFHAGYRAGQEFFTTHEWLQRRVQPTRRTARRRPTRHRAKGRARPGRASLVLSGNGRKR
jgi:predicted acylesterase/phospholipase RssA